MKPTKMALFAVALLAVLFVAACGEAEPEASEGETDGEIDVTVSGAWVRQPIGETTTTGAFMEIRNNGSETVELTGASVDPSVAGMTQVHETTTGSETSEDMDESSDDMSGMEDDMSGMEDDGSMDHSTGDMAGMREVEAVEIPAGETVKLEKGGYHVMLMDIQSPFEVGETVELTLVFSDESGATEEVTVDAEVRAT